MSRRHVPTTFPHCSHIASKRGLFHYRRRLPSATDGEFTLALRTTDYREARHLAAVLDRTYDRILRTHRLAQMIDLKPILRDQLAAALRADQEQHLTAGPGRSVYSVTPDEDQTEPLTHDLNLIDLLIDDAAERLARREVSHVRHAVSELANRHGIPAEQHTELAIGLLQIELETIKAGRQRLLRGAVEVSSADTQEVASLAVQTTAVASPTPLVSVMWPQYVALKLKGDKPWRAHTRGQNDATFRMFIDHCGDRSAGDYQRSDFASFFMLLGSLPALYAKSRRWRGMTLAKIAASPRAEDEKGLTTKTIKRHKAALSGFFGHLMDLGYYQHGNPVSGHRISIQAGPSAERKRWEGDKLRRLFNSPLFKGSKSITSRAKPGQVLTKDAKYWLPILGIYQGARLEELAQLLGGDVGEDGGIPFLDINDQGNKQVKNAQSRRRVPIHPTVLQLGFLEFVREQAISPEAPVFPELVPGGLSGKRSDAFTRWFPRYRQQIGVYEEWLDFHSFRHTLTRKLYDARIDEVVIDVLTGHKGGSMSRSYKGHGLPLPTLREALSTVSYEEIAW